MSVDYLFYERTSLGKKREGEKYSFIEGYHIRNALLLCQLFQLPNIPFYRRDEKTLYDFKQTKVPLCEVDFPNFWSNLILFSSDESFQAKRNRYQDYKDWLESGLLKLNSISLNDIENLDIDKRTKEVLCNTSNEVKKDIPYFLTCFKEHRYLFMSV